MAKDPSERANGDRPDFEHLRTRDEWLCAVRAAARQQGVHARRVEASERVPEHVGRGRVDPLDVIDRDEGGGPLREHSKGGQERDGDGRRLDRSFGRLLAQQDDRERLPLRRREVASDLVERVREEVAYGG